MAELGLLFFIAIVGFIVFIIGALWGDNEMRNEAVEKGYAEYYLDDENEKRWRWKEPK